MTTVARLSLLSILSLATACIDVGDPLFAPRNAADTVDEVANDADDAEVTDPYPGAPPGELDFATHIAPILATAGCAGCHFGGPGTEHGLDATSAAGLLTGGTSGPAIVPCDHAKSRMWQYTNAGFMPYEADDMSDADVNTIAKWIDQGGTATFVSGACPNAPVP